MSAFKVWLPRMPPWLPTRRGPSGRRALKNDLAAEVFLAQDQEILGLITGFLATEPNGNAVQQVGVLIRTVLFKPANQLVGFLLPGAVNRVDSTYQPKPGEHCQGRVQLQVQCPFGTFALGRNYDYHPGKQQGH
jgi:hypothetical protein